MSKTNLLIACAFLALPAALHAQISRPLESWGGLLCDENGENCDSNVDGMRAVEESRITVLASGQWTRLDATGQPISVLTRADIEAVQGADFARLAERLPGVALSRNGGAGSFTALRVRGAEAEQVLVLVDGVRLADPAAPAAGFDSGTLTLGSLERVELLRSANSTIWGSQALGGVLAVESVPPAAGIASGNGGPVLDHARLAAEYGAFDSRLVNASIGASAGPVSLALGGGWRDSDGISAAADGTEADGHRQVDIAARASARFGNGLSLFAQARLADARLDIDGFPAPDYILTDTAEYQDQRQVSGLAGAAFDSDYFDLQANFAAAKTDRQSYDPAFGSAPGYTAEGTSERAELRGRVQPADEFQLRFGAEREWLSFSTLFDAQQRTASSAAHVQAEYNRIDRRVHLAIGLRRDDHRQFGGAWSLGADGAWEVADGLRLTASYGEGFKAPSLFQLLSDYGNAALRPETARSYDAGLAWEGENTRLALTGFRRDTRDQIVYDSCFGVTTGICAGRPFGTYDNRARTRAWGFEAEAHLRPAEGVDLSAVYALTDTEDRTSGSAAQGNSLARRPRHSATITAEWQPVAAVSLAADLRLVSHAWDNAVNTVRLDGYQTIALRGSWDMSEQVQFYARIENLTDTHYQTAAGYAQAGRSAYIGARLRM